MAKPPPRAIVEKLKGARRMVGERPKATSGSIFLFFVGIAGGDPLNQWLLGRAPMSAAWTDFVESLGALLDHPLVRLLLLAAAVLLFLHANSSIMKADEARDHARKKTEEDLAQAATDERNLIVGDLKDTITDQGKVISAFARSRHLQARLVALAGTLEFARAAHRRFSSYLGDLRKAEARHMVAIQAEIENYYQEFRDSLERLAPCPDLQPAVTQHFQVAYQNPPMNLRRLPPPNEASERFFGEDNGPWFEAQEHLNLKAMGQAIAAVEELQRGEQAKLVKIEETLNKELERYQDG